MGTARAPAPTVTFVDEYCAAYRDLFDDVRSFEHLCLLHLGLISDLPRKSLPAIDHRVGADPQALHNFIANADWSLDRLRQKRLELTREALRGRSFVLIIDETGDLKKGKTTDYLARQYIGNIGAVDCGIVSVSAYLYFVTWVRGWYTVDYGKYFSPPPGAQRAAGRPAKLRGAAPGPLCAE